MAKKRAGGKRVIITSGLSAGSTTGLEEAKSSQNTEGVFNPSAGASAAIPGHVPTESNFLQRLLGALESWGVAIAFLATFGAGIGAYHIFTKDLEVAGSDISELKGKASSQESKIVDLQLKDVATTKDIESISAEVKSVKSDLSVTRDDVNKLKADQAVIDDRTRRRQGYVQ